MKRTTQALFLLLLSLILAACSEQQQGKRAVAGLELFGRVPADTPYVAASSRALPEALSKRMLKAVALQYEDRRAQIEGKMAAAADGSADRRFFALFAALNDELKDKLTPEGLASIGFPLNGRSLIYGLGVLPVAWVEVVDEAKVNAFLDRVESKWGESSRRLKLDGIDYRRFDFDGLMVTVAVEKGYLVAALLPSKADDDLLSLALGARKPEKSLADTGGFKSFVGSHRFLGYGEGYVDLRRLTELALGEAKGENAKALAALGFRRSEVDPACRPLVKHVVQAVPRFSFGYIDAKADSYRVEAALETSPAVGAWLTRLPAAVPGLGKSADATFSLGLGLNLPKVRDALKALINDILQNGKGCPSVDRQQLAGFVQSLDMVLNPMVAGIRGFNFVLDRLEIDPRTLDPKSVEARLLLASTDPRGLLGMSGMLDPNLAMLQVPSDGKPVKLPLQNSLPQAPPAWVAIKGEALGLFLGAEPPKEAVKLLQAGSASPTLIFHMGYDLRRLLRQVGPSLEQAMRQMSGEEAADVREFYRTIKQTAALYDRVDFTVHGEKRGLVMEGRVTFYSGSGGEG